MCAVQPSKREEVQAPGLLSAGVVGKDRNTSDREVNSNHRDKTREIQGLVRRQRGRSGAAWVCAVQPSKLEEVQVPGLQGIACEDKLRVNNNGNFGRDDRRDEAEEAPELARRQKGSSGAAWVCAVQPSKPEEVQVSSLEKVLWAASDPDWPDALTAT